MDGASTAKSKFHRCQLEKNLQNRMMTLVVAMNWWQLSLEKDDQRIELNTFNYLFFFLLILNSNLANQVKAILTHNLFLINLREVIE